MITSSPDSEKSATVSMYRIALSLALLTSTTLSSPGKVGLKLRLPSPDGYTLKSSRYLGYGSVTGHSLAVYGYWQGLDRRLHYMGLRRFLGLTASLMASGHDVASMASQALHEQGFLTTGQA